jgi:hypothetical protein
MKFYMTGQGKGELSNYIEIQLSYNTNNVT